MRTHYFLYVVLVVLFVNCKNETSNNSAVQSETKELSILDTLELKLNNGNKWIANIETHIGIKKMDSIISDFKTKNTKDFISLGSALSNQSSYVIKNCTMKGEPHDQLHVVLVPMLDEITILKDEYNEEAKHRAVSTLEKLINDYFSHFSL
jgi:hypothetical protein